MAKLTRDDSKGSPDTDPEFARWLEELDRAARSRGARKFSWRHEGWRSWRNEYDRRLSAAQAYAEYEMS